MQLDEEIARTQGELDGAVAPAFEDAAREEREARARLAAAERRVKAFYAKQSRGRQFASVEERDRCIAAEAAALDAQTAATQAQVCSAPFLCVRQAPVPSPFYLPRGIAAWVLPFPNE